ncbi:hypothetical protein ABIC89_002399 [Variovorax boronicumulans]|uniref:hypothetical protein n=1 Tax=Variovorax boronicumulans TaxID=436515 RepID=UPI0033963A57
MNRTDVVQRLSEIADLDTTNLPDDAVSQVSWMIDHLDPKSPSYEANVETLLSLGATIWTPLPLP